MYFGLAASSGTREGEEPRGRVAWALCWVGQVRPFGSAREYSGLRGSMALAPQMSLKSICIHIHHQTWGPLSHRFLKLLIHQLPRPRWLYSSDIKFLLTSFRTRGDFRTRGWLLLPYTRTNTARWWKWKWTAWSSEDHPLSQTLQYRPRHWGGLMGLSGAAAPWQSQTGRVWV